MKKTLVTLATLPLFVFSAFAADEFATPKEAEAMVAKASAAITADKATTFT